LRVWITNECYENGFINFEVNLFVCKLEAVNLRLAMPLENCEVNELKLPVSGELGLSLLRKLDCPNENSPEVWLALCWAPGVLAVFCCCSINCCSMYFLTTLGVEPLARLLAPAFVEFKLDIDVPIPLLAVDEEPDGLSKLLLRAFGLFGALAFGTRADCWAVWSCFSSE